MFNLALVYLQAKMTANVMKHWAELFSVLRAPVGKQVPPPDQADPNYDPANDPTYEGAPPQAAPVPPDRPRASIRASYRPPAPATSV